MMSGTDAARVAILFACFLCESEKGKTKSSQPAPLF
jgi:hypothetical protein